MTRLQKLRKMAQAIDTRMQNRLNAAVDGDEPRAFTDEEQAAHDADNVELKRLTAQIDTELDMVVNSRAIGDKLVLDDETANTEVRVTHEPGDDPFESIGEQLQAIQRACDPSNPVIDDRQKRIQMEHRAASGLSEAVPADGGFQLQKDFVTEIKSRMHKDGEILSRVTKTPISANSNGLKFNVIKENSRADGSRWGGVRAYWTDEAATFTASKPELRQVELTLSKLTGLMYTTGELMADAPALSVRAFRDFSAELRFKTEDAFFEGDGAGKPLGILGTAGTVSVAKESGQAAATIVYENILNMWRRMRNRSNSVWMINQDIEGELNNMSVAVGTGGHAVYLPAGGLSVAPFATLMGRPVIPIEYAATLGTVGDISLCDWSAYEMIDKGTPKADSSIHVRFLFDEEVFRVIYRVDGQPLHNSPLTPYKGTDTQGHFITLATRA